MEEVKVSVIILCYNQRDTVGKAIESVLTQKTPFRFEILLSDDASSDGTADICRTYAEKYPDIIRFLERKTNLGIQRNYFDTFLEAKGEYIADCAGDDSWHGDKRLAYLAELLDRNPKASAVHSAWYYVTHDGKKKICSRPDFPALSERGTLVLPILRHDSAPIIHLSTALFRRKILAKDFQSDPQLYLNPEYGCEDLQIITLLSEKGDIIYTDVPTLNYSIGHDSASARKNPEKAFKYFSGTINLTSRLAEKYGVDKKLLYPYYSSRVNFLIDLAYSGKSRELMEEAKTIAKRMGVEFSLKSKVKMILIKLSGK